MLEKVLQRYEQELPTLLQDPKNWQSLMIDYDQPIVWRLWRQVDDEHRLMLHRIEPTDKPLTHQHFWPSGVHLLSGIQKMRVGRTPSMFPTATLYLPPGTYYEMLDPDGWHDVAPQGDPSWSTMITGIPWKQGKKFDLKPLTDAQQTEMLTQFKTFFPGAGQ